MKVLTFIRFLTKYKTAWLLVMAVLAWIMYTNFKTGNYLLVVAGALAIVGGTLNSIAILSNGGYMPSDVSPQARITEPFIHRSAAEFDHIKFWVLCNRITIGRLVCSVGDLLIYMSIALLIMSIFGINADRWPHFTRRPQ